MMPTAFQARAWILIERAADVSGEWVAHCLDFDVVMQERDLANALRAVQEAVTMVVFDDLERGADPRARRAPEEYWNKLSKMLDHAEKQAGATMPEDESTVAAFAAEMVFVVQRVTKAEIARHQAPAQLPPVVEMAFTVQEQRVA